jgi:hypothetical protein
MGTRRPVQTSPAPPAPSAASARAAAELQFRGWLITRMYRLARRNVHAQACPKCAILLNEGRMSPACTAGTHLARLVTHAEEQAAAARTRADQAARPPSTLF